MNRPPKDEPWIWLTRELLASDAWRSLSINARRLLDFLMTEWMTKGGRQNGKLKAPHRQLRAFGIGAHDVGPAIRQAEDLGLIECHRGGMRVATTYALTWLPLHDGRPATDFWRGYRKPVTSVRRAKKIRNLPAEVQSSLPAEVQADDRNLPAQQQSDGVKCAAKSDCTSAGPSKKYSYQGGGI
jgi:hypothetical protein